MNEETIVEMKMVSRLGWPAGPKKVRRYHGFASLPNRWNIELFYTIPEMYLITLFICIKCGEVFVIDSENPNFSGKTTEQVVGNIKRPKCEKMLRQTIKPNPESFRTDDGHVRHFESERLIPPDSESFVKESLEIC